MTTITISIPDDHLKRLQEIADRLGITLEELLRARKMPSCIGGWHDALLDPC